MATTILSSPIITLYLMCVIVVAACLLTRSRFFPEVFECRSSVKAQVIIILGALLVYGTEAGSGVNGAFFNVCGPGPMPAGLPADFTVCSCVPATVLAGLFGGLFWLARSQGMDSKTMMAKILDKVKAFCGDHPRSDDITLTSIRTE
jgi:LytS/YehU family sensor histidine kinase